MGLCGLLSPAHDDASPHQGCLRDQLLYPRLLATTRKHNGQASTAVVNAAAPSDEQLTALLHQLGLGHLMDTAGGSTVSLDVVRTWETILSVGEQQRIAFVRLLTHR